MIEAIPFAQTSAGYLTSILATFMTLAILAIVGYLWKDRHAFRALVQDSFQKTAAAQAVHSQALAVLVESIKPVREKAEEALDQITITNSNLSVLKESTALLTDRLNRHEQWSREHERRD